MSNALFLIDLLLNLFKSKVSAGFQNFQVLYPYMYWTSTFVGVQIDFSHSSLVCRLVEGYEAVRPVFRLLYSCLEAGEGVQLVSRLFQRSSVGFQVNTKVFS